MQKAKHNGHAHHARAHHITHRPAKRKIAKKFAAIAPLMLAQYKKIKSRPVITLELAAGVALFSAAVIYLLKRNRD